MPLMRFMPASLPVAVTTEAPSRSRVIVLATAIFIASGILGWRLYQRAHMPAVEQTVTAPAEPTESFETLSSRGVALAAAGDRGAAEISFRRALEIEPDNVIVHSNLVSIYADMNSYEEARMHLTAALAIDPFHAPAVLNGAIFAEKRGDYREAGRFYLKYLTLKSADQSLKPYITDRLRLLRAQGQLLAGGEYEIP